MSCGESCCGSCSVDHGSGHIAHCLVLSSLLVSVHESLVWFDASSIFYTMENGLSLSLRSCSFGSLHSSLLYAPIVYI